MMNDPEGYANIGKLYRTTVDGNHIQVPVSKNFEVYPHYVGTRFDNYFNWSSEIYDCHHRTIKGWNNIYEFDTIEEVKIALSKLRMAKELLK